MRFIIPLIFLILFSCSLTNKIEDPNQIQFSNKEIGRDINYYMTAPSLTASPTLVKFISGHGEGFQFQYSTAEILYYSNDNYSDKPNNKNYKTINWLGYSRFSEMDTTLGGMQDDGRYWREIKKGSDFIGYLNVLKSDTSAFNEALKSFKY